jgi:hypothetical protein
VDVAPANNDMDDDDAPVDVDAYLNTGADIDDLYMPSMNEEPFRSRDDQAGSAKATKQRLVFSGLSEDTPPAADTQEPSAANIFSPNTLLKKVNEQFEASGAIAAKKPQKRLTKNNKELCITRRCTVISSTATFLYCLCILFPSFPFFLSGAQPPLPMGVAPEARTKCLHLVVGSTSVIHPLYFTSL